ncbi:hypothetical protein GGX14DRAFT_406382 [Mycena pura]|uniref:Uncharacterized protein n=1 Tax=Mycena pura TaxID=153505 RepID=A0AAD6UQB5_9AGAR|nr:hypothetical protein GGX14DRAFT_406382 [Mycena pura]
MEPGGVHRMWTHLPRRLIPEPVALEAVRLRQIPSEVLSALPSELLSPAGFFANSNLPSWDPAVDVGFNATEPTLVPQKPSDNKRKGSFNILEIEEDDGVDEQEPL